jgi:hypothetical protein
MSIAPVLSDRICRHYRAAERTDMAEWVKANITITAGQSADYAGLPMDVARTPHSRLIFDFLNDPEAEELNVQKSSAAAMTSTLIGACLCILKTRPRNILYLIGNQEEARKMSNRYWKPWIRQVFGDAVADEEGQATLHLKVNGVNMISGSPTEKMLRGIQFAIIIEDESDTMSNILGGGSQTIEEAERERVKNTLRSKIIRLSTPLKKWDKDRPKDDQEGARINRLYLEGDQRLYHCPCPGCGVRQEIRYDDLAADDDRDEKGEWRFETIMKSTFWKCPKCGRRVEEGGGKRAMVEAGQWVASVSGDGRIWSAWHSDTANLIGKTTWGRIRHDLEKKRGTMSEAGVRRAYLAEPEDTSTGGTADRDRETVLRHCGHHARGTCPIIPWRVTCYVDVQKNCERFPWVTHALTQTGEVYVLDWGECEEFSDLFMRDTVTGRIHGLLSRPIPLAIPETLARATWPDESKQPRHCFIKRALIDSGYMAKADKPGADDSKEESVYQFCAGTWDFQENRYLFVPAKGRGGRQISEPTVDSKVEYNGRILPLQLYDDWTFRRDLYNIRLASDPENPSVMGRTRPRIYFPRREDVESDHKASAPGQSFLSQLLSERIVVGDYKVGNLIKSGPHWQKNGPNDYGDGVKGGLILHAVLSRHLMMQQPAEI